MQTSERKEDRLLSELIDLKLQSSSSKTQEDVLAISISGQA